MWPLVGTTFTLKECEDLMKPLLWDGLSKSGIVRTLKREVVHGPKGYCALGLPHFYVEQGIYKIQRICKYTGSKEYLTGSLMRNTLENLTVELGLPGSPFSHDYQQWKSLSTNSWIKSAWEFMPQYGIEIIPTTPMLQGMREGDSLLMQRFYRLGI